MLYLQCTSGLSAYRYLIVQFPRVAAANICELEVYIYRKFVNSQTGSQAIYVSVKSFVVRGTQTLWENVAVDELRNARYDYCHILDLQLCASCAS